MVKKYRKSAQRKHRRSIPIHVGNEILLLLKSMGGNPKRARLASLWMEWRGVMGDEFANVIPLGHHDKTLLLGAGDAMEIQELALQSGLILEKVNEYLQEEYFSRVRITLHIE